MTTTAAVQYNRNRASALKSIESIVHLIERHADRQARDAGNWGLTGDMGRVATDLAAIVAYLHSGEPRE